MATFPVPKQLVTFLSEETIPQLTVVNFRKFTADLLESFGKKVIRSVQRLTTSRSVCCCFEAGESQSV